MKSDEYDILVNIEKAVTRVETKLENTVSKEEFGIFKAKVTTWGSVGLLILGAIGWFF